MPKYSPKSLGYNNFIRSNSAAPFQSYSMTDCSICWIDLLGVRGLSHSQIVAAVHTALNCASEASCTGPIDQNGNLIGTPNSAIQYSIVGDALILSEKNLPKTRAAAKLAFFYRVNILSRLLNEQGYLHRGVITSGEVDCFIYESSTLITGKGVVKAASLEANLKTAGLFYDETWDEFINWRQKQLDNQNFIVPFSMLSGWNHSTHASGLSGVTFSQYDGWVHWDQNIQNGNQSINKVINAQSLINDLRSTFGLP
ncbi:hypothetical protein HBN50_14290 [Halobacteriovorax sp. GB3]|uniref:hypothetical protein n=1 Tax=Halobacteriovorax sp. GB3 TaxID=2719615 RepID=UPI00235F757A|nr:hypothetical protein [Halobacteriovorax sp. GB3]MDD0854278.1 hypothetical protein [Halobacteriovorax sp. GB3]